MSSLPGGIAPLPNVTSGARYFRCAFQVNPHGYAERFRATPSPISAHDYPRVMLDSAEQLGIDVIAITDHNSVADVPRFVEEAQGRQLTIFPGFEVASTEGVHVLCLFEPGTEVEKLNRVLGELGVHNTDPSAELCEKTFSDVLEIMEKHDGLTIAAHITESKGLLMALHGSARARAWRDPRLLAAQVPADVASSPIDKRPILENVNPDYKRDTAPEEDLAVAVINAKDVTGPDDLADPRATCWVKMTRPSVEGLRQAFLDPRSRIRLHGEQAAEPLPCLLALSWQTEGVLKECVIRFNENLNVLVGGRGAGKSAVVESIRAALGIEPLTEEAKRSHQGITKDVLRSGTKLTLWITTGGRSPQQYLVERVLPDPPTVRGEDGKVLSLKPRDILPIHVLGQHEISELANDKAELTRLLERFVEPDRDLPAQRVHLQRKLEKSRDALLSVEKDLKSTREGLERLPAIKENLRRFENAGLEEKLKEQTLLITEERVLTTVKDRIDRVDDAVKALAKAVPLDASFLSDSKVTSLPGYPLIAPAKETLTKLSGQITAKLTDLAENVEASRTDLEGIRTSWGGRKQSLDREYQKILRELQRDKVDGAEFIHLRKEAERLQPLEAKSLELAVEWERLVEERRTLLADWRDVLQKEHQQRERAAKRIRKRLTRVRAAVRFGGDRRPLLALLKARYERIETGIKSLSDVDDLSLHGLAAAVRLGKKDLVEKFGVTEKAAERLAAGGNELAMLIEELDLPSTTTIEFNPSMDQQTPDWKTLDQLSKGQKASAVLLLLLLGGDGHAAPTPLIVDQPEDDLDNRFVTESIVPTLRSEKMRRQFLFATHNANIPVLGDAELIVGLEAAGEASQGRTTTREDRMGSIDMEPVRDLVGELLEGGKRAFELRRKKYRF